jgi:hypothetical protein
VETAGLRKGPSEHPQGMEKGTGGGRVPIGSTNPTRNGLIMGDAGQNGGSCRRQRPPAVNQRVESLFFQAQDERDRQGVPRARLKEGQGGSWGAGGSLTWKRADEGQ